MYLPSSIHYDRTPSLFFLEGIAKIIPRTILHIHLSDGNILLKMV